jgi:D-glycero-D-manno-heptose 1,7-bisphosphate phosphatase
MKKAAFLDRDGVINQKAPEGGYILRWEEFQLLPAVSEAITLLNRGGFLVVVVTNQQCVARGLITMEGLEEIHDKMRSQLAATGARIDAVYYCPHGSEESCDCRKPGAGMLLAAAKEHKIHLEDSWMIGDSERDIAAGRSAGCSTVLITGGNPKAEGSVADRRADSLLSAVEQILNPS